MPKIQKTKQGLFVYLPKAYTQLLGWNKGDTLAVFPDRQSKQTLVIQKTLDAITQEPQQSINALKEAEPVKIQIVQQPRPTNQTITQPRPTSPINNQQRQTTTLSEERLKQLMEQRRRQGLA